MNTFQFVILILIAFGAAIERCGPDAHPRRTLPEV
jgi:hypothetical protein